MRWPKCSGGGVDSVENVSSVCLTDAGSNAMRLDLTRTVENDANDTHKIRINYKMCSMAEWVADPKRRKWSALAVYTVQS